MTVSTPLKKRNFINTFCFKYYHYWEEGLPLSSVLKEESVHWMIFVMLFMWCIDGIILWLLATRDWLTDIKTIRRHWMNRWPVSIVPAVLCRMYHYFCQRWNLDIRNINTNYNHSCESEHDMRWTRLRKASLPSPRTWDLMKVSAITTKASQCVMDISWYCRSCLWCRCLYDYHLTPLILGLQSHFKGNSGLQILISLQNNGKPLLYLPKISWREGRYTQDTSFMSTFPFFSPSLYYETLFAIKAFFFNFVPLKKNKIVHRNLLYIYMNKNIYVEKKNCSLHFPW